MNIALLFRKRNPLSEDGLPWLSGSESLPWVAARNTTGAASVSAILVRALLSALEGNIHQAQYWPATQTVLAVIASRTTSGASTRCWLDWKDGRCGIPHGEADKITYHIGALAVLEALARFPTAMPFWSAYCKLLAAFRQYGKGVEIKESLVRAADELYYWLRFADGNPDRGAPDRLAVLEVGGNATSIEFVTAGGLDLRPLTDLDALRKLSGAKAEPPKTVEPKPVKAGGFVGWQADAMRKALLAGENALLAGPTGTGKTYATQQAVLETGADLVVCEGKEGLMDLDFLGAILPQPDGSRKWVDGPILRAMRAALADPVVLFLDEINRIPRQHLNLLLGLMNPKSGEVCQAQGLGIKGEGPFYVLETPMTSEVVWCPAAHLRFVAAGNFGRAYQVYDLDPAVRRRFETVIEFDYLGYEDELALVQREHPGLPVKVTEALVKLAHETRRLMGNGELPGCVDTASLMNWTRKCARSKAETIVAVMAQARLTWADLVCGRDHMGKVNAGAFQALQDYLVSLGTLPDDTSDGKR